MNIQMPASYAIINLCSLAETVRPIRDIPVDVVKTYQIAVVLMDFVRRLCGDFGARHPYFINLVYFLLVAAIAFVIGITIQYIVVKIVVAIGDHFKTKLFQRLLDASFFTKTTRIITPVVFLVLIEFTMAGHVGIGKVLTKLTVLYILYVLVVAICAFINAVWQNFDARDNTRKLPLKGVVQLIKGIIWLIGIIVAVGYLLDKSPAHLLAGLGAFAAVLMLVFKDSILGVVAGVQLSENDSLHVGDWITVDGTNANGNVEEVSLTMVKVRNWDKTVTCLPPYTLVSGSFTNMRDMETSNSRRIDRCLFIDADSVMPLDDKMLEQLSDIPFLKDYIAAKQKQQQEGKVSNANNPAGLVDGTIETNLGLFRAYLKMYLDANNDIDHTSDCFVTTREQTSVGVPLQIYCFTNTSAWFPYEAIQAYIFEHIAVMMHKFGLYIYESVSGRDTLVDGYLCAGKKPQDVFGLPYPFFMFGVDGANGPAYPQGAPQLPKTTIMPGLTKTPDRSNQSIYPNSTQAHLSANNAGEDGPPVEPGDASPEGGK